MLRPYYWGFVLHVNSNDYCVISPAVAGKQNNLSWDGIRVNDAESKLCACTDYHMWLCKITCISMYPPYIRHRQLRTREYIAKGSHRSNPGGCWFSTLRIPSEGRRQKPPTLYSTFAGTTRQLEPCPPNSWFSRFPISQTRDANNLRVRSNFVRKTSVQFLG